jgi:ubiquitin carboxyl-terminal hydrolase L3
MDSSDLIQEKMKGIHWVPLESNPDMLNAFGRQIGMPDGWQFCDVYGVDPELLSMVPQPVVAVTLLFQCSDNIEKFKETQKAAILKTGQKISSKLFYMKQYVNNACGTVAATHAIANNAEIMGIPSGSPLDKFLFAVKGRSPEERGLALADAKELHSASEASAQGGQTEAPEATADIDHHFICFVEKEGDVYELDGRKFAPINHGAAEPNLLFAVTRLVKEKFMDQDPGNIQFNMMACCRDETFSN